MTLISDKQIYKMNNDNKIIGHYPETKNSSIIFSGKNNILYCESNVRLEDSTLNFAGNNSIIYLCSNRHPYKLSINIFNDCVFHMGKDNYINQKMTIILSEQKHCFIGDNGMFSINITMRNADPHLIYKCSTGSRTNISKSIYIGDHVWIGQDVLILKGTQIDSGSIIGAKSVLSAKKVPHNSTWAGNPCKQISDDIFWDNSCVHNWTQERTEKSMQYSEYISEYKQGCHTDYWIYKYNSSECLEWEELEQHLSYPLSSLEKCEYLLQLNERNAKNRFAHSR